MATLAEKAAQLRAFNESLLDDDLEMVEAEGATNERLEVNRPPQQAIDLESIIMRRRRPVLAIQNGTAVLEFKDPGEPGRNQRQLSRDALNRELSADPKRLIKGRVVPRLDKAACLPAVGALLCRRRAPTGADAHLKYREYVLRIADSSD